ncbi:PEP-CTERM sorting domain-containing protein [Tropicimonas sediminicola]|uniref:VPLPA-CTERM protein sorting domain-containing protein n=1 Tax=Tropicimonas sediminicola TaxID=1031541 RepID=A0A239JHV0_9RHOB|nr:PEP-CTERM sorting domain-containing protein [Tropicimonas sediminicola]SNT05379.1 VPLPA-CTERM protein sorting domain-containing protein [Tropicimonas sediminicola]
MSLKASAAAITALALSSGAAGAVTFQGEFWDTGSLSGIADAEAAILSSPTALFTSSGIDYPNGDRNTFPSATTTVEQFLGVDGASLTGSNATPFETSVFRFTGQIYLSGGAQTFSVSSDDGFWLDVDGIRVAEFASNRGFRTTTVVDSSFTAGFYDFELVYWENTGSGGIEAALNGATLEPVPLPASLSLALAGFAGLGVAARRRARRRA